MSFSPGQFITAARLNRLQPAHYWAQASSAIGSVGSGDVAGTSMNITVQTNGATATMIWTAAIYASGLMSANANTNAVWDVNLAPTYALAQHSANGDKVTASANWTTTIPTAGTYTFKLKYTNVTNASMQIYTTLLVIINEVA